MPGPSPLGAFLEHRVADELAASGTPLSRSGVSLRIEAVGDQLTISLVDPTTQEVIVSTKAVALADREATVASLVPVATSLVQRMSSGGAPGADVAAALEAERAERHRLDERERAYREQAIAFGDDLQLVSSGQSVTVNRTWVAYRGEVRKRLEGPDFYNAVGRPDLAEAYDTRRNVAIGVGIGAVVAFGVATYLVFGPGWPTIGDTDAQLDAKKPYQYAGFATLGVSALAVGVAVWIRYHPNPISENEAKDLAAEHNAKLRHDLGLPGRQASVDRRRFRDVVLAPYADHGTGGFVLTGRF